MSVCLATVASFPFVHFTRCQLQLNEWQNDWQFNCPSHCPSGCLSSRRFWVIANPANEPISVDPIGSKTELQTEMESQSESKLSAWCSGRHISFQYMQHCWLASAELMWPMITSNDWLPKIPPNSRPPPPPLYPLQTHSESKIANETEIGSLQTRRDATPCNISSKCNISSNLQQATGSWAWASCAWRCWPTEPHSRSAVGGCGSVDQCGSVTSLPFVAGANCTRKYWNTTNAGSIKLYWF